MEKNGVTATGSRSGGFDRVFTFPKTRTKEEFLRELLIKLAAEKKSPVDIVTCEFGEVEESYLEYLRCSAHVEYDVTASIGYDRQEQYIEQERYYDKTLEQYRYRDVVKTRTVTDWRPFSAHGAGDTRATVFSGTSDGRPAFGTSVDNIAESLEPADAVEQGTAFVSAEALENAKSRCAYRAHDRLPGDRQRDERYSDVVDVKELECYKAPFYRVEYTYKGAKFTAVGMACGNHLIVYDFPKDAEAVDLEAEGKKVSKSFTTGALVCWIGFGVVCLLSAILCWFGISWVWAISPVFMVCAILLTLKRDKVHNARVYELGAGVGAVKQEAIEKALAENGYAPLDEGEKYKFSAEILSIGEKRSKSESLKKPIIICSVVFVIIMIFSLVVGIKKANVKSHQPNQFTVSVTSKTEEYDPYASPYIYGCYYVTFQYQISAKKYGAEWMELETVVYKDGTEIGTVTTKFSNMDLDAKETKTFEAHLSENQPEKNAFFNTLYNTDFSKFTFKTNIVGIEFSDGNSYYQKD